MTIWQPKPEELKRPAYRSLATSAIRAIEKGLLKPGDRLPTHRSLSYDLGVSVQTVSRAYEELNRLGYTSGEVGRGTFVAHAQRDARTPFLRESQYDRIIDLSILKPVVDEIHLRYMRLSLAELSENLPAADILSFRPNTYTRKHRETAIGWLQNCGVSTHPDSVILTNGNTPAMTTALMSAAKPGELVATEEMGHHTLTLLTRYLGLKITGLPIDAEGIVPDALEESCRNNRIRALYIMPNGANPKLAIMSTRRRLEICRIAAEHDIQIIENDAWGPLRHEQPTSFATLAPERTYYFTSFTKCLMPGLRTGYLVVPEHMIPSVTNRHMVTNWTATPIMAEIAARMLESGTAGALLDWQMNALVKRRQIASEELLGIPHYSIPGGLHVWIPLPTEWNEDILVNRARQTGVAIAPGSVFDMSGHGNHRGVRVCIGPETEDRLRQGLRSIASILRSEPEPALLTI